jgi:hypothetical protein
VIRWRRERELTAKSADLRPCAGAESHAALHGSAHDAGERWGGLGDRIFGARAVLARLETAAAQEPPAPSPDRAKHLRSAEGEARQCPEDDTGLHASEGAVAG